MIFSPEWLQARGITHAGQPLSLEISANFASPPRMAFRGLTLRVDSQKLVLGTDSPQDDRLADMEQVIGTILDELPHTPVAALGINFQWTEQHPPLPVLRCFDTTDAGSLAEAGLEIGQSSVIRRLNDHGRMINLNLTLNGGEVYFDFNFHHEVASAVEAGAAIQGAVISSRDRALEILQTVYELEPITQ